MVMGKIKEELMGKKTKLESYTRFDEALETIDKYMRSQTAYGIHRVNLAELIKRGGKVGSAVSYLKDILRVKFNTTLSLYLWHEHRIVTNLAGKGLEAARTRSCLDPLIGALHIERYAFHKPEELPEDVKQAMLTIHLFAKHKGRPFAAELLARDPRVAGELEIAANHFGGAGPAIDFLNWHYLGGTLRGILQPTIQEAENLAQLHLEALALEALAQRGEPVSEGHLLSDDMTPRLLAFAHSMVRAEHGSVRAFAQKKGIGLEFADGGAAPAQTQVRQTTGAKSATKWAARAALTLKNPPEIDTISADEAAKLIALFVWNRKGEGPIVTEYEIEDQFPGYLDFLRINKAEGFDSWFANLNAMQNQFRLTAKYSRSKKKSGARPKGR
jgi:hypothetical protein